MKRDPMHPTVVQIAPLPPPYGGVSVHARRLAAALSARGLRVVAFGQPGSEPIPGVEVVVLRRNRWPGWLASCLSRVRPDVVHSHRGWTWSKGLLLAALAGARVVVTVHSQDTMDGLDECSWHDRLASRRLLASRRVRWIAVSPDLGGQLVGRGAPAANVLVAPAYMPIEDPSGEPEPLPSDLQAFVSAHRPLLTVYGWRDSTGPDGKGWYGFDLAIAAADGLRSEWPECGLLILLPTAEPLDRVEAMRTDVRERGMDGSVCIWTSPLTDPTTLWRATDVYLRPTRTDGDAVTVREMLALGRPVVASDCCERPEGVRLFATDDADALEGAIRETLSAPRKAARAEPAGSVALKAAVEAYGLPPDFLDGGTT